MAFNKDLINFCLILLFISIFIPLIQYHIQFFGYFGISGVFVNDTQSYWGNLVRFHDGVEDNYYTLIGVLVLYYPAYYFGWIYCYLINFTLLFLSCNYFLKTTKILDLRLSNSKLISIYLLIVFNFYLWGILFFPNKEIPLIFLTNLLIYLITTKKKFVFQIFIIFLIFFFRDGFAFILMVSILAVNFFKKRLLDNPFKYLFFFISFLMFFSLETLSALGFLGDYQYVIDRNIAYESESRFASNLPYFLSFLINLFNNSIIYAFRAQLFDLDYRFYFHGIGLWQFAVLLSLGLFSFIFILKKINYNIDNSSLFSIAYIVIISYILLCTSSYPQVRYMMPFVFWLSTASLFFLDLKKVILIFIFLFFIAIFLILIGLSHRLGSGLDIDNFSKSLFSN
uniref:hypothetical protein n=1 Tax=Algoriphagus sp. TaxID=1872435 RepID=UPI0040474EE6